MYCTRTETQDDVKARIEKDKRNKESTRAKRNVENRTYDYRIEPDIGGALLTKAKRVLTQKIREEIKTNKRQRIEEKEKKDLATPYGKGDEQRRLNELHEDDDILGRLTQDSGIDTLAGDPVESNATLNEKEYPDVIESRRAEEKVLYHWLNGYAAPRNKDLEFLWSQGISKYFSSHLPNERRRVQLNREKGRNSGHTEYFTTLRNGPGRKRYKEPETDQMMYFPRNEASKINGEVTRFTHWKHLRCMAARYLCGAPHKNLSLEERFIRSLHSAVDMTEKVSISSVDVKNSILYLAHLQGENALCYSRNHWSNSEEIAHRLGVVQGYFLMPGRTLSAKSIDSFGRDLRRKLTENHSDETKLGLQNDLGFANPSKLGNADTASFSVDESRLQASKAVNSFADQSKHTEGSFVHNSGALVMPTTTFVYLAGMTPPIPNFPLDPSRIIFGPVDRYAQFYHRLCQSDDIAYKLTVSTLLSRLARARTQSKLNGVSRESIYERQEIHNQITSFIREFTGLHRTDLYKMLLATSHGEFRDLPLVPYYRALMGFCSFYANGNLSHDVLRRMKNKDSGIVFFGDGIGEFEYSDENENDFTQLADEIFQFCAKQLDHNGLLRFPRLQIIFALSQVSRSLPKSAAELLSTALDDYNHRTPLDILRRTLEHLEKNELISGESRAGDNQKIPAGELEYLMYEASKIFSKCVRNDSFNFDLHLWHIGALSSCLLLCSGNRIGSGASLTPSKREKGDMGFLLGQCTSHDARPKMPKYVDVRCELLQAVRNFFTLCQHQSGPRVHMAITSLLEWREVIALLGGKFIKGSFADIRALHRHHSLQWAMKSQCIASSAFMRRQQESESISYLAKKLENDPMKLMNWKKLAWALGPIGSKNNFDSTEYHDLHRQTCEHCQCLNKSLTINHRERKAPRWWGKQRRCWKTGLLKPPKQIKVRRGHMAEVMKRLCDESRDLAPRYPQYDAYMTTNVDTNTDAPSWLPKRSDILSETGSTVGFHTSSFFDSELPKSFIEVLQQPEGVFETACLRMPTFVSPDKTRLEHLCYKILITCHLQLDKSEILCHICPLIDRCVDRKGSFRVNCDEFTILRWLCSIGLDIPNIIKKSRGRRSSTK